MRTYFSFGLILQDIPNSVTPQTTLRLLPASVDNPPPLPLLPPLFFLSRTEEPATAGTRDRRALQQLALNVHIKHTDLT